VAFWAINKAKNLPNRKDPKRLYSFKALSWQASLKRVKADISKMIYF